MTDKCALVCDSLFPLCNLPFLITAAWVSIWGMLMIVTFLFMSQLLYSLGDVTEQTATRSSIDETRTFSVWSKDHLIDIQAGWYATEYFA